MLPEPGAGASVRGAGPSAVPPKKKRKRPEGEFQEQAVSLLRLMLPEPCRVWYVPNQHIPGLPPAVGKMLQRMGLLAGVHDLHVMVPGGFYTIECKAGRGALTPEQEDFALAVEQCGHDWQEARTLDDIARIAEWIAGQCGLRLRPVTLTPGGFVWDRGPR